MLELGAYKEPVDDGECKRIFRCPIRYEALGKCSTSYGQLPDDVRQRLAEAYLRDPDIAMCEVGYLVGCDEQISFTRAFKRWTGTSPTQFRRQTAGRP